MSKVGEILINKGLVNQEQLTMAIEHSRKTGQVIGKTLVELKLISEADLLMVLGEQLGIEFFPTLHNRPVSPEAIASVPVKFVWHYKIMPLEVSASSITVAVSDPLAVWAMEDLKLRLNMDIQRVLATQEEIMAAIRRYYGFGAETVQEILDQDAENSAATGTPLQAETPPEQPDDTSSVTALVNNILTEAVNSGATDVHLEPYKGTVKVRTRVDGVLYDMHVSDQIKYLYEAIVSRIKIISNLNIVEKRLPQDGRAIVSVQGRPVDLRISIIPSVNGEGVVIRVLPGQNLFSIQELGYTVEDIAILEPFIHQPHGIVFVTGPTGSGKTTTLYAFLNRLDREKLKIITIEDPVEYAMDGIMQIQIKPEIDFTFSSALRSILRHDPDVMMVGEVRDQQTAELAIRSALTGHLLFSTLHTNDAASGAARLLDIGVEPYLVASAVNVFIAQRLVRRLCPMCKSERGDCSHLSPEFKDLRVMSPRGCDQCNNFGFKGRTAIYEILPVSPEIQELIIRKASASQLMAKAREQGMRTLFECGRRAVAFGYTTPEEILQVVES